MRRSKFFLPLIKEQPTEAAIVSHSLMLRAGMIRQLGAGIYNWLPLGLRVLNRIADIVREEMNRAGAQEILMPTIQPAELWIESGRYEDYGKEMLRLKDRHERDLLYGPTNEEVVTDIFRQNVRSYKELPLNLYQIQWKFRDEIRPRFGVMRGREFLMKDAYSFDVTREGAVNSYRAMLEAYLKTFRRLGLNAVPVRADSGAIGGDMSQEFHILAETGESEIFYDAELETLLAAENLDLDALQKCYAAADEKHQPENCPVAKENLRSKRGIEVGHVFYFGTKYSKALGANVTDSSGASVTVEMGSYGIGVSRLVGAVIEANHDQAGIIWPEAIAPFDVAVIVLKPGDAACEKLAEKAYETLTRQGKQVLLDDTSDSAGAKFAAMELIGIPWQIVIGPRSAAQGDVEIKSRRTGEKQTLSLESALTQLTKALA
jgi:prolyl-tRNA synthetase